MKPKKKGLLERIIDSIIKLVGSLILCVCFLYMVYSFEFNFEVSKKHHFAQKTPFMQKVFAVAKNSYRGYKSVKSVF